MTLLTTDITSPKERAVSASSRLLVALIDCSKHGLKSGKFCVEILKVLNQPALPGDINLETRKTVSNWRASAGFGRLSDVEMNQISDQLEPLVKAIRISIASEIVKRENRRADFNKRERERHDLRSDFNKRKREKGKHDTHHQSFKPTPSATNEANPYAD
jgi:hypothetical protein